jgi:hypothetical protein
MMPTARSFDYSNGDFWDDSGKNIGNIFDYFE